MSKRLFDVLLSGIGLVLAAPVMAVAAALIRLDSPGPILFRQVRIGRHGRPFTILKFRTMVDRAATLGPRLTQKRDPRVTRVGQVLRWLKLDELPQLANVLRGDMSLVGPRPEDPHFVALYTPEQRAVLSVRPGIVGPSQILGRDELERYPDGPVDTERFYVDHILPEKLTTDLQYVRSASLLGDVRLVTVGVGVTVLGVFKRKFLSGNRGRIGLLALDTLASLTVYLVAHGLKFDWRYTPEMVVHAAAVCGLIVIVRPLVFLYFGLCQQDPRYVGAHEFLTITRAVTVGSALIAAATFMLGRQSHSRLVFLMDWGLLIVVLFGIRIALQSRLHRRAEPVRRRIIVVGAGQGSAELVSALADGGAQRYQVIGLLDDDPARHGVTVRGVTVRGRVSDLPLVTAIEPVDLVMVLFSNIARESLRALIAHCRATGLEYRLVPTLDRVLDGVSTPEMDEPWLREAQGLDPAPAASGPGNGHRNRSAPATGRAATDARTDERLVLVTGGAGYVGSHLVRKLLARGYRVRVVDSYLYGRHGLASIVGHARLELIEGDIRHLRTMAVAVKGASRVIALAALVGDAACEIDPEETISTNYEATRLLAEVCERSGVRRLVFASSCSVYGANADLTLNEGSWLNPVSLYARTRIDSEEELLRRIDRLGVTILRLATVFGLSPRMRLDLLVNTLTAHAFFDRRMRVMGGNQWRPSLHVQDAAEAFIAAAEADDDRVRGETFNVGSNTENYTVLDVARRVQAQRPEAALEIVDGSGDERDYRVSFDKIRHVLNFRTRFTVDAGICEMLAAFSRGVVPNPDHERYHNFRQLKTHGFSDAGAAAARVAS